MATVPNTLKPEEYLRLERASEEKHEYVDGQMVAMEGKNRNPRRITANIYLALRAKEAECGCVSDSSDTRLFMPATKSYTYPDVVRTCGEEQRHQDDVLDTLRNPTLIVEVHNLRRNQTAGAFRIGLFPEKSTYRYWSEPQAGGAADTCLSLPGSVSASAKR